MDLQKKSADSKVQTYKARHVAKSYSQREGIDYQKTFSPVAMLKSIRTLLAFTAYYDYEIWQIDVKTTFLNRYLEEDIYMEQPLDSHLVMMITESASCKGPYTD